MKIGNTKKLVPLNLKPQSFVLIVRNNSNYVIIVLHVTTYV